MKYLAKIFLSVLVLLNSTPYLASAQEVSQRPILFIHGFNPFGFGEDCGWDFDEMKDSLSAQGFTGQKITLGYYWNDLRCDVITSPNGTILTHIPDLSKDLAWYIYEQFSSHGVSVDVVTHSMGSLLLRYALYRSSIKDPTFPPYLRVKHAATMAGPFTGYGLLAESCHLNILNIQCDEMFPHSSFIEDLNNPKYAVPQGLGGTLWSAIGSNADYFENSDGFVTSSAATSMSIPDGAKTVLPWHMLVFHSGYTHNKVVLSQIARNLRLTNYQDLATVADSAHAVVRKPSDTDLQKYDARISHQDLLQDFSMLPAALQPARIFPHFDYFEIKGFAFKNVRPGGVFAKMQIQEGDVVRGCSDAEINAPFQDIDGLEFTKGPTLMKFCVVRDGSLLPRTIRVD